MSRFLWTQKEDIGPSARFGHAMAYDSVRSRTILFGGSLLVGGQAGSVNDTWEWNGEFWTQIADTGPAARQDHASCFDSVRQTALLFGGLSEQNALLGDTWSWNGEDWTQVDDSGLAAPIRAMTTTEYDEYEVIDADSKQRLGRFSDLGTARQMAQTCANAPHGKHRSIEIWGVVVTRTREQVETVTRTETEQRSQGEGYSEREDRD